jgi:hypothetical protein
MKKKCSLTLDNEFLLYCELNNIDDSDKLAKETFERGFSLLKYGETPTGNSTVKEKIVEKEIIKEVPIEKIVYQEVIKEVEVIVEVIKEVPVEKIVEIIKEVPIQIKGNTKVVTKEIIKEVPIEKIVYVTKEVVDTKEIEKLTEENKKLKDELTKINTSLEKLNKGRFLKNSDLGSLYSE